MILPSVGQIYSIIDGIAPFDTAEPWDNVGLLCGRMDSEVKGVLCALDMSEDLINEALTKGANLIVTHHPIMFKGRKNLTEHDAEGRMLCALVRNNISLIAAHTNYDVALGGVNDCLARSLGLKNVRAAEGDEQALVRVGDIDELTLGELSRLASERLGDVVRVCGDTNALIRRVAVCGGAGGEYLNQAFASGADAYLTGEIRYHDAIDARARGLCTLECGHGATERIAIKPLAEGLQNGIHALQCKAQVFLGVGVCI